MGSSESDERSEPWRSRSGSRASTAGPSRRASTGSSSRSPLSRPQAPPLPAPPSSIGPAASSQRPQQVTVETETVPSVPTVAVVSSAANGSLRAKRSQESVPRVPQARASKKRSLRLTQGSKADIFAAKVANAVDEQDSSGSDETFVYDTTQPSQLPPSQAAGVPSSSTSLSLAGDSLRRPYRRTGSTTAAPGGSRTPLNHAESNNNGYFASLSSHPGYETEDYSMEGPDDATESHDGQVSPAPQWPASSQHPHYHHHQSQPVHSHPSPRSFVVPKQSLTGRQRLPPSPFTKSAASLPSQESSTESLGAYADPEQAGPKDHRYRDLKDSRARPFYVRENSRPGRHPSRSASYADDEAPLPKDSNNSIRAKTLYLQRWRTPAYGSNTNPASKSDAVAYPQDEVDERASLLRGRPSLYNYHARSTNGRRRLGNMGPQANSTGPVARSDRDPERMSQFSREMDSSFGKFRSQTPLSIKLIVGSVTILICLLSLAFVAGLLVAASQPLKEFYVLSLSDAFVSDKELVFSMILHARNPSIFATSISEGELDIFATSNFADDDNNGNKNSVMEPSKDQAKPRTVLLGTVMSLESPVTFHGGKSAPWQTAPVKLVGPLANNTRQWTSISSHEFDLTVKGFLSYKVLGSEYRETVSNTYHVPAPGFILDGVQSLL